MIDKTLDIRRFRSVTIVFLILDFNTFIFYGGPP